MLDLTSTTTRVSHAHILNGHCLHLKICIIYLLLLSITFLNIYSRYYFKIRQFFDKAI